MTKLRAIESPKTRRFRVARRQTVMPSGEYYARVAEINDGTFSGKRRTLEFIFEIAEGPFKDQRIRGFANAHYEAFSNFTKLYQWYSRASGDERLEGEEFDLGSFYDKVLIVHVETKESRKTKNQFSNVTDVLGVHREL